MKRPTLPGWLERLWRQRELRRLAAERERAIHISYETDMGHRRPSDPR
jgi:hypothetical protein